MCACIVYKCVRLHFEKNGNSHSRSAVTGTVQLYATIENACTTAMWTHHCVQSYTQNRAKMCATAHWSRSCSCCAHQWNRVCESMRSMRLCWCMHVCVRWCRWSRDGCMCRSHHVRRWRRERCWRVHSRTTHHCHHHHQRNHHHHHHHTHTHTHINAVHKHHDTTVCACVICIH